MRKCRHCGREIPSQDYRIVGYETNDARIPENIIVHTDCLAAYRSQQQTQEQAAPC